MKFKNTTLSLLLLLPGITINAQDLDPGWLWAERGGSSAAISGSFDTGHERIVDIAVDGDNNYYYLAEVGGFNFTLGNMEFENYNNGTQNTDVFIFSTDQDGNFRWSKIIGGGAQDRAASIAVDDQGDVYVSGTVFNFPPTSSAPTPVHFDTDSVMPEATLANNPANKKIFLIKYDMDGNFQWLRQPEGDETPLGTSGAMLKTVVESDGTTHSLIWLMQGTYFDGQLLVEEGEVKGTIVKYNSDGDFIEFILLDMSPLIGFYNYQLVYNANLNRYYIADTYRSTPDPDNPLSINGYGIETVDKAFYLAAVDSQGEVIWYHENEKIRAWSISDVAIDNIGNVFITGRASSIGGPDSFAGYVFDLNYPGSGQQFPFLIKLDSDGNLLWGTNPDTYSPFNGKSIAIKGENVFLGLGMLQNTWGEVAIPGPSGIGLVPDVQIVRFNSQTGEALQVIHNNVITSTDDAIMAMALDNNGDLVVGGYFGSNLFINTDLHINNTGQESDFFIAKYSLPQDSVGVSTSNREVQTIKVYPNPTTGMLNLQSDIEMTHYAIYDLQGRMIEQGRLRTNQIDLSGLEAGVYIFQVQNQNKHRQNFRVVKA